MKIAVLLASFNRKEKTLACIRRLKQQVKAADIHLEIHLTDDASSDGTALAVQELHPDVFLYKGSGALYWAGGMRNSWKHALGRAADYYLLLNDDVLLMPETLQNLVEASIKYGRQRGHQAIFVGATKGDDGKVSYGGRQLHSRYHPQYRLLLPRENDFVECDLGDGNIMFIPSVIVEQIGILSDEWTHGIADHDYCYKAKKAGFPVVLIPGIQGHCNFDKGKGWKSGAPLSERLQYLHSPTGLQYREYLKYIKRYYPYDLPISFLKLWTKTLLPFVYDLFKKDYR